MLEKGWITVGEAAKLVGKTVGTIYHRIAAEDIEVSRVGGRLFVKRASLESYYNSKRWLSQRAVDEFKEKGEVWLGRPGGFTNARGGYYRALVKEAEGIGAKLETRRCGMGQGSHDELWVVKA